MKYSTKRKVETLFLDYVNNFLSVERFAEYYGMDMDKANRVIKIGRKINDKRSK